MRERGFFLHILQVPFITFLPWPAIRRRKKIIGIERPPKNDLYLKSLNAAQIKKLEEKASQETVARIILYPAGLRSLDLEYIFNVICKVRIT